MAEPSSGNNEEKEVTRSGSFTKFLGSPSRENSMKKNSSNPLSKLLFRRRSSRRRDDNGGEPSSPDIGDSDPIEEEKDQSLMEEVKEVVEHVETAFHDLIHHNKKETSVDPTIDAAISIESRDASFSESKESKHHFLGKIKEELGKAKEGLKEEYGKAKEELKAIMHKAKSEDDHDQPLDTKQNKPDIITDDDDNKKLLFDEVKAVKAPNLVQRLQEEVVAVISTIDDKTKGKTSQEAVVADISTIDADDKKEKTSQEESKESKEIIKEEKKEDNCVSSLAQGLQNLCSWGSKKED